MQSCGGEEGFSDFPLKLMPWPVSYLSQVDWLPGEESGLMVFHRFGLNGELSSIPQSLR